jgi:choline dehydrogenase-like flavoprotein
MVEGANSIGIPAFENPNGRMMEGQGGAALFDVLVRDGKRQSLFRSYTFPYMDRPNLTVLTHALVTRVIFDRRRATGVEIVYNGQLQRIAVGSGPHDPIQLEHAALSHPEDLKAAITCVELCREVGNSAALRPFVKREVLPGNLKGLELEAFIREAVESCYHQTCTAKMRRDSMSVVDGNLKVYGIDNLRVADGSIMPRVTSGNTMAPCVIIGERAGEMLKNDHKI